MNIFILIGIFLFILHKSSDGFFGEKIANFVWKDKLNIRNAHQDLTAGSSPWLKRKYCFLKNEQNVHPIVNYYLQLMFLYLRRPQFFNTTRSKLFTVVKINTWGITRDYFFFNWDENMSYRMKGEKCGAFSCANKWWGAIVTLSKLSLPWSIDEPRGVFF